MRRILGIPSAPLEAHAPLLLGAKARLFSRTSEESSMTKSRMPRRKTIQPRKTAKPFGLRSKRAFFLRDTPRRTLPWNNNISAVVVDATRFSSLENGSRAAFFLRSPSFLDYASKHSEKRAQPFYRCLRANRLTVSVAILGPIVESFRSKHVRWIALRDSPESCFNLRADDFNEDFRVVSVPLKRLSNAARSR